MKAGPETSVNLSNRTNILGVSMNLTLALVGLLVSTPAFAGTKSTTTCTTTTSSCDDAAEPAIPSTCGTDGKSLCDAANDEDMDGFYKDSSVDKDCNDEDATVHPGGLSVIGDGLDNNCDGKTGEDAADFDGPELDAAIDAAGGAKSPKGRTLAAVIASCTDESYSWLNVDGTWVCGVEDGYSFVRQVTFDKEADEYTNVGVLNETQTHERETKFRIAGDRKATATAVEKVTAIMDAKLAELGHPYDDSDPTNVVEATGLYAVLNAYMNQSERTNADHRLEINRQIVSLNQLINSRIGEVAKLRKELNEVHAVIGDLVVKRDTDIRNGPIFEVGAGGMVQGGKSLYTADPAVGGMQVRSGMIAAGTVNLTIGTAWPNHQLTLDIGIGGGTTVDETGTIPASVFTAGVAYGFIPNGGNLSIAPTVIGIVDTTRNPFRSSSSELGAAVGVKAGINLPSTDPRSRREIYTTVYLGVANVGFDDFWSNGPIGGLSLSVDLGRGPVR